MVRVIVALVAATGLAVGACTSSETGADTTVDSSPEATTSTAESVDVPSEDSMPEEGPQVTGERTVAYAEDFEATVGDEWSSGQTDVSPVGERRFLGQFGNGPVTLALSELGPHDALVISFDLFVLRSWRGGTEDDRWGLSVDGTRLIDTTFSNDDATQAFPANIGAGAFDGGTGAAEQDSLGFSSGADGSSADSVYRIEREFLHSSQDLAVTFNARTPRELDNESWGIDNVEVTVISLPEREAPSNLSFNVVDGRVSVAGVVPTEADRELVRDALGRQLGGRVDTDTIELGADGPKPLWLFAMDLVARELAPSENMRLELEENAASGTGMIRTSGWYEVYESRLDEALGDHLQPTLDLEVVFSEEIVTQIERLRVLFELGSADLDDAGRAVLDELTMLLKADERLIVRVDGHADSTGVTEANQSLSRERASAALAYLMAAGIDRSQLLSTARGSRTPEVEETTQAGLATNRRVSFVIPRG